MRRHQEIWPAMVEALRSAGISNYSIFRHGLTLFGYFETDDIEKLGNTWLTARPISSEASGWSRS
jgi:L-rhamnose mutarotase